MRAEVLIVGFLLAITIGFVVAAGIIYSLASPDHMLAAFVIFAILIFAALLIILGYGDELSSFSDLLGALLGFILGWIGRSAWRTDKWRGSNDRRREMTESEPVTNGQESVQQDR